MYVDEETPEEAPQEETNEQEEVESTEEATSEENTEAPEEEAAPEESTEDSTEAPAEEPAAEAEAPATGSVKTDDRGREIHEATCADCGQTCEIPFKPDPEKPVYCRDCYQKHKPPRRSFGGGGGGRGGGGGGFSRGPREMHDATCAKCGKACQVPFKPSGDRPVYCRDCYQK
tara:strand:- start:18238 stop:18756 length:519 start_codon:yes stop_codon:yes gene_type:complete